MIRRPSRPVRCCSVVVGIYIISCTPTSPVSQSPAHPRTPSFSTHARTHTRFVFVIFSIAGCHGKEKNFSAKDTRGLLGYLRTLMNFTQKSPFFTVSRTPALLFVPFFHEKDKYYNPLKNTSSHTRARGTRTLHRLCTLGGGH